MIKYIIKNKVSNNYYSNKYLDQVALVEKNAYKFTIKELIELDLINHFAYDRMEIIQHD